MATPMAPVGTITEPRRARPAAGSFTAVYPGAFWLMRAIVYFFIMR